MTIRDRFSPKAITELGVEKRCLCCGEYWPADLEFFAVQRSSRDGLSPRCIACIKAKAWRCVNPPAGNFRHKSGQG